MPISEYSLSYVITTRNKLPFLKHVLTRLLKHVQQDEEIVVTDGSSTDGTAEYLSDLYKQGLIHQFISEKDRGESHGYNKGFLMARGELIKIITDDDVFSYPAIRDCKKYMLEHKDVDVIIGNTFHTSFENYDKIECQKSVEDNYFRWLNNGDCFPFTGLSLMFRKQSLAFIGLFSCGTSYPDTEFSLRITSTGANIAWNSSGIVIRVDNPGSNMRNFGTENNQSEVDRFYYFYDKKYRMKKNNLLSFVLSYSKKAIKKTIHSIKKVQEIPVLTDMQAVNTDAVDDLFIKCDDFLAQFNADHKTSRISSSSDK